MKKVVNKLCVNVVVLTAVLLIIWFVVYQNYFLKSKRTMVKTSRRVFRWEPADLVGADILLGLTIQPTYTFNYRLRNFLLTLNSSNTINLPCLVQQENELLLFVAEVGDSLSVKEAKNFRNENISCT